MLFKWHSGVTARKKEKIWAEKMLFLSLRIKFEQPLNQV